MTFGHNLDYVHNSLHLTRWVASYPISSSFISHWYPPIKLVKRKPIKCKNATGTFYFHPSSRHSNRHPDVQTCMTVDPDTLHLSTNFHPLIPIQSEVLLILNNLACYPLPGLKCTPCQSSIATTVSPPPILVC